MKRSHRFQLSLSAVTWSALALTLTACDDVATSCPPVPTTNVVTIPENYPYGFDALPGDRLDVILDPVAIPRTYQSDEYADGSPASRCAWMGGTYRVDLERQLLICEGVDF